MTKNNRFGNVFQIIGFVFFATFSIIFLRIIWKDLLLITDSDISSEMMYANILINDKVLISQDWYFSTFVDFFNINKIFSLIFIFTSNWKIVHFAEITIYYLLMIVSTIFVSKEIGIKNYSWMLFLTLGSLSYDYFLFSTIYTNYSHYIMMGYFTIGLIFKKINNNSNVITLLLLLLTIVNSMCGMRNVVTLYLPICLALILVLLQNHTKDSLSGNQAKEIKKCLILIFFCCALGVFINKFGIQKYVGFENYSVMLTREPLNDWFNLLKNVIVDGWLYLFGFTKTLSLSSVVSLLIVIILIIGIIKRLVISNNICEIIIITVFVLSSCFTCGSFFISTTQFEIRYLLQSYSYAILIFGLIISQTHLKKTAVAITLIVALLSVSNTFSYLDIRKNEYNNDELIEIVNILDNKNIKEGYATYWDANLCVELSNGNLQIKMYKDENVLFNNAYNGNPDDIGISKDLLWKWLQRKSTIETDINYPCFMIVQNHRLNLFDSDYLKYVSYNGDHKTLLIFQNDSQLKEVLLK